MNPLIQKIGWTLLAPLSASGVDAARFVVFLISVPNLWNRPFDRIHLRGVGAEIGVYRGMHAKHILRLHPEIESLWLVDPYLPYGVDGGLVPDLKNARRMAQKVTKRYERKVHWIDTGSPECAGLLPMLDFCYIDANHTYESVSRDIEAMWPKINPGGVLGGHDFHFNWLGLIRAVVEFVSRNNLQLNVDSPDWWVFKK
jgi:hypothetical protein